jgi:hypothetical protein
MESSSGICSDGSRLPCYGLFTCISERCKRCPSAFICSKDSGSRMAHKVMIKAKLGIIQDYEERGLDCSLTMDGKILFH